MNKYLVWTVVNLLIVVAASLIVAVIGFGYRDQLNNAAVLLPILLTAIGGVVAMTGLRYSFRAYREGR
jgi:hypothetical protein